MPSDPIISELPAVTGDITPTDLLVVQRGAADLTHAPVSKLGAVMKAASLEVCPPLGHQHARADLPWINDPGAALLTADSASAQRTALGMTAWAVAPWTDGTTSDIPEGTRLYFTNARADARIAAQKGQAEGLAPLDAGGKVPSANLPDSIAQADDSARLGGQLPSYYAQASHVHTFAGLTSKPTTLAGYGITDAAAASHTHNGYETAIGNPSANGYLLSSTSAGVRSWVAPYSHPATHAQSVIDSSSGWITTALAGKQAAGSYLTTTGTAADSAKLGGVAASGYSQTSHTHNYAGSSSAGGAATTALACTGNTATATALATPRTLTIGSKANTFDGTADKTWSLADIGAASTAALTTEATTRVTNDNAIWAALYAEQTGGTTCEIPLAATGDGSGVLTLRLWSDVANTATLSNGAFYGEIGGTTNLGQSVAMTAGQYTTFYIKLPSGSTATMSVLYGWALTRWGQSGTEFVVEATNAPKLNGLNTKYIPANVTTIRISTILNAGVVAGTTYPWASATYILFSGNSMTLSGTTYPWTAATIINFAGTSMTLSGTTYQWTYATYINFSGNSMTLSGTTYPWTYATNVNFYGSSMTLSADLSTSCLTTGNLYLYLSGTGIAVTYTTTRLWPTTMRQVYLRPSVGSMPTADTDRLFIDVDATCTTASSEKLLDVRGSCGAVTAASSAARASLVAKGFTVSFNS